MEKVKYLSKINPIFLFMAHDIYFMNTMGRDVRIIVLLICFIFMILSISVFEETIPYEESDGDMGFISPSWDRGTRSPGPDLTLDPPLIIIGDSKNITFSDEEPNEGDTILINSTVTNNGDESATAYVEFYDGPPEESDIIGSESVLVEPGLSIDVSTQWNTSGEEEDHVIYVVVDPEDSVNETDENNNIVLRDIVVNQKPVAEAGEDIMAFVDHQVTMDGSGSWDSPLDMDTLNYTWDFGDGNVGYGEIVEHTYLDDGIYSVSLTVRDIGMAFGLDTIAIEVRHLPVEITLTEEFDSSSYLPGEEVEVSGTIEMEFSPSILDIKVPVLTVNVEILETRESWSTTTDSNGDYEIDILAPNSTGTYTVKVSIAYGPIERSSSKILKVSEREDVAFITVGSGFLVVALVAMAGVGAIYWGSELGRYRLLLLVFIPLYTRIKKDKVLDHFHRGRLYNYIETHPGVTFTELKKKFAFKNGNMVYHLNFLEKMEFIRSTKEGRHRRFFIKGDFSKSEDFSLYINEIQKKIISVIHRSPGITQSKIANFLGTSRQKISYNINALEYAGIIRSVREGSRKIRYYPGESQEEAV
jgi:DNA-binding MarR family transcriptional regulator